MTVVNPKSISGINSITTGSGSDDILTIHTNNGTERLRVDSTGATKIVTGIVTTLTATTGIVTTLTANTVTSLGAVSGTTGIFSGAANVSYEALKLVNTQHDTNAEGAAAIKFGITNSLGERNARIEAKEEANNTNDVGLDFYTNSTSGVDSETLKMRVTAAGKVGIGISNPTGQFAVSDGTRTAEINPHSSGTFIGNRSNHDVLFQVNAATKAKIDTNGHLTISDGDLVIGTSGHGIDFSATSDGSGTDTSELFDDYEEGTWTPNIRNDGATATWTTQQGRYVKIGEQVTVWFNADGGSTPRSGGGSGALIMTGLPFTQVMFGNPILGIIGANDHANSGLYSTAGLILNIFGQGGTQVRFGVGGQSANFGINYVAGCFTYTA